MNNKKNGFMQRVLLRTQKFMYGRYGFDEYSAFLTFVAIVLIIIGLVASEPVFSYISLAVYIYSMFRTYSRNISKRSAEGRAYMRIKNKIKSFFSLKRRSWKERKTHKYFKCPDCKTVLRVPKGKGKIRIHCSGCGKTLEKNT